MPQFHRIASTSDIAPGTGKTVMLEGKTIAIFQVNGKFHAINDTCPHQHGPLGEGTLDGTTVACPWHGWTFDLTTGKCGVSPTAKVEVYPTKVEGQSIFVEI